MPAVWIGLRFYRVSTPNKFPYHVDKSVAIGARSVVRMKMARAYAEAWEMSRLIGVLMSSSTVASMR
jgi:hypothetical protein